MQGRKDILNGNSGSESSDDPRTDAVAREAARMLELGECKAVGAAIRAAAHRLNALDVPRPGFGTVREHARAMAMQALGDAGYRQLIRRVLQAAEELMTALEFAFPDVETLLVGRAAREQIDGGVIIHIRAYTDTSVTDIARTLVEMGYDEPGFASADTRFGKMSRVNLVDDGLELVITRIPPHFAGERERSLFSGKPIRNLSLEHLRKRLQQYQSDER